MSIAATSAHLLLLKQWLDVTQISLLAPIMRARLDLAKSKNCDGVEPDNVS